jgi:general secretion pathway protein C
LKNHLKVIIPIMLLTGLAFLAVKGFYWYLEQKYAFVHAAVAAMVPPMVVPTPDSIPSQPSPENNPDPNKLSETPAPDTENQALQKKLRAVQQLEQLVINLRLKGTIAGDKARTQAIIADSRTKMDRIYRIGSKVENAVIKKIMWDKVILSLDGQEAVLAMGIAQGGSVFASSADSKKLTGPGLPGGSDSRQIILNPSTIDEVLKNISQSQSQVAVQPHLENGKPAGVKLSGAQVDSLMSETGIRSGDIIKSVNGQAIKSMNDAMRIYENLKTSGAKYAAVQILRDGRLMTIYYHVP